MTTLAVIPARGGSKGVPRKNIRPLGRRPLLAWSIRHAMRSTGATDLLVSTEDDEVAAVARDWMSRERQASGWTGSTAVLRRPAELATDDAPTDPVLIHAVRAFAPAADRVVLLQPTSPFRPAWAIDECLARLADFDSVFTAVRGHFAWQRGENGAWRCSAPSRPRRQDMAPTDEVWLEDGGVYAVRADVLLRTGQRIAGRIDIVEVDRRDAVDIDTEADWRRAEALYHERHAAVDDAAPRPVMWALA